jgi:hypothetical protein
MDAGMTADGAFPNAATPAPKRDENHVSCKTKGPRYFHLNAFQGDVPAGKLRTPAPTILLIRLKTSLGMVAVPPDSLAPPRGGSAAAAAAPASFPSLVLVTVDFPVANA